MSSTTSTKQPRFAAISHPKKANVDFPAWVVKDLDKEADRLGVARQSLIKVWIVERLEQAGRKAWKHPDAGPVPPHPLSVPSVSF